MSGIGYDDTFADELPKNLNGEQKDLVKSAIRGIVSEFRKELIEVVSKNKQSIITGEIKIDQTPTIVLGPNVDRRVAYLRNQGDIQCKLFSVNSESTGGVDFYPKEMIEVRGTSPMVAVTAEGISLIGVIDS